MELSRKFRKPHAFFLRLCEMFCGARDQCYGGCRFIRAATQARAIALFFGFFARSKENDVTPQRAAGRAGWPAINVRRPHSQHERAVGTRISRERRAPVLRGFTGRDAPCHLYVRIVHRLHATKIAQGSKQIYPERLGKVDSTTVAPSACGIVACSLA